MYRNPHPTYVPQMPAQTQPQQNNQIQLTPQQQQYLMQMTSSGYPQHQVQEMMMEFMRRNMQFQQMQPMMPQMGRFPQNGNAAMIPNMNPGTFMNQGNFVMPPEINDTRFGDTRMSTPKPEISQIQQQMQIQEQTMVQPVSKQFTVKAQTNAFLDNANIRLKVITEPLKLNSMTYVKHETTPKYNCFDAAIEGTFEEFLSKTDRKVLSGSRSIVHTTFYDVVNQPILVLMYSLGIKDLYKYLRNYYSQVSTEHDILPVSMFNNMLTEMINDYIAVNSSADVNIDNFYSDFNDLLKFIRDNEETLEDELVEYMDGKLKKLAQELSKAGIVEDDKATTGFVTEILDIFVLNRHVLETGLSVLEDGFVMLEDKLPNKFLLSIASEVFAKIEDKEFILVTIDRSLFKFFLGNDKNVYIKRM